MTLEFEDLDAVVTKVLVNEREAKFIFLQPHEIDITSLIAEGGNLLEIEITNSLRNLIGPHHHKQGDPMAFAHETAEDETHDYQFVPFGLGRVKIKIFG